METFAIENEDVKTVSAIHEWNEYPTIETEDGQEYVIFESSEVAGQYARDYWVDMAQYDPQEFACIVGEENLIQWGLGKHAGPGYKKVQSIKDWFDLWLDTPEGHFAQYDGAEVDVRLSKSLQEATGLPHRCVAYRSN